jgi:hypothetical protein
MLWRSAEQVNEVGLKSDISILMPANGTHLEIARRQAKAFTQCSKPKIFILAGAGASRRQWLRNKILDLQARVRFPLALTNLRSAYQSVRNW